MNRMILSLLALLVLAALPGSAQDIPRVSPGKARRDDLLVQERREKVQYALDDEKAAKAASDEAKARAERDQAAYNAKAISAAELSASLAAREKFFFDYLVKGSAVNLARHDLQRATILAHIHVRSIQELCFVELFKSLAAVQEKQLELQYALDDEKSAKAAADEAKARATRDQAAYDAKNLSAAELSASLAASEKYFYAHLKKGTQVRIARIHLELAKQSLNPRAP